MKRGDTMQIIKRDGQVAEFDPDKIYQAIIRRLKPFMLWMIHGDKTLLMSPKKLLLI